MDNKTTTALNLGTILCRYCKKKVIGELDTERVMVIYTACKDETCRQNGQMHEDD